MAATRTRISTTTFDLETAALPERIPSLPGAEQALAGALRGRLDLREAELQVDRSHVGIEVARDGLRPGLNLSAWYTALTDNVSSLRPFGTDRLGDVASAGWQAGVSVTLPVGNNVAKAGFRQATLVRSQQEAVVATVQSQIRQQVRQAVRAIQMSGDRVRQSTEALEFALAESSAENQRLQLGLSDSFRLLQFEDLINDAQQAQLAARFSLAQAMVSFDLARGESAVRVRRRVVYTIRPFRTA